MVSFLNGLSALGAGVAGFAASAGIEQQKADLARQSLVLADQLATNREVNVTQPFAKSQLETTEAGANARNAASNATAIATNAATNTTSLATNAATIAGDMARTQATINAPPETIKLLRALGVQLPDPAPPAGGSASSGSARGGGRDYTAAPNPFLGGQKNPAPGSADVLMNPDMAGQTEGPPGSKATPANASSGPAGASTPAPGAGTASTAPTPPVADPMENPIVQKALGYPASGSEDALRRAVAADVKSDPAFRYKTAGQQASETELRVQVAKGAMTSPATQAANAAMIASYQIKPPDGFALSRPGAAETMAMVTKFNPDYQESRFPEINKAMSAFGSGPQGNTTRALDVGTQHLDVFDQAVRNLGNTNVQVVNTVKNAFAREFGSAAPTTMDGLKQIVATEIEKAVAGGIGSAGDRDRLVKSLDAANSPAQLLDMTAKFRALMAGQLDGLKRQYENDTGFKQGPFAFENKLGPAALKALAPPPGGTSAPSASTSSTAPDPDAPMTPQQMYGGSGPIPARPRATPPLPPGFRVVQ